MAGETDQQPQAQPQAQPAQAQDPWAVDTAAMSAPQLAQPSTTPAASATPAATAPAAAPAATPAPAAPSGISAIADAIAQQEGAKPELNNPGNIKDSSTGKIRQFGSPEEGRAALESQIRTMIGGSSEHYPTGTTLRQAGLTYSGGDPNWSKNVARILGVSEDTPLSQLGQTTGQSSDPWAVDTAKMQSMQKEADADPWGVDTTRMESMQANAQPPKTAPQQSYDFLTKTLAYLHPSVAAAAVVGNEPYVQAHLAQAKNVSDYIYNNVLHKNDYVHNNLTYDQTPTSAAGKFWERFWGWATQDEINKIPGLEPDRIAQNEQQGSDVLGRMFGKQRADDLREHILHGYTPEIVARAAAKSLTDFFSPGYYALGAFGRVAQGYEKAAQIAQAAGDDIKVAQNMGKARLLATLSTGVNVPFAASQAYNLAENWDKMNVPERVAAASGIVSALINFHVGMSAGGGYVETAKDAYQDTRATVQDVGQSLKKAVGAVTDPVMLKAPNVQTAITRAMQLTGKQYAEQKARIADAAPEIQKILNENPTATDPTKLADAVDKYLYQREQVLQQASGATKDSNEPVSPTLEKDIRARLNRFFDENRGKYGNDEQVDDAKSKILGRIMQTETGGGPGVLRMPNAFEAENIRQGLNNETKPQIGGEPTTNAYRAAAHEAVKVLRDTIDGFYHSQGIQNVAEFRQKEATLIDISERMRQMQKSAEEMGNGSLWSGMMKKFGSPVTLAAMVFGTYHPLTFGALAPYLISDRIYQNYKNPNVNIARAIELAKQHVGEKAVDIKVVPRSPLQGPSAGLPGTSPPPIFGPELPPQGGRPISPAKAALNAAAVSPVLAPDLDTNHDLNAQLASHFGEPVAHSVDGMPITLEDRIEHVKTDAEAMRNGGVNLAKTQTGKMLEAVNDHEKTQLAALDKTRVDTAQAAMDEVQKLHDEYEKNQEAEAKKDNRGLVEHTTGEEWRDVAIRNGGGIPAGFMNVPGHGDYILFHDPQTGSTLAFKPTDTITPQTVGKKLAASRAEYEAANPTTKTGEEPFVTGERQEYVVPTGKVRKMEPGDTVARAVRTMGHEYSHFLIGHKYGMRTNDGIISGQHPSGRDGKIRAGVAWDPASIFRSDNTADPERLEGIVKAAMAGVAYDEAFHDVHRASNKNNDGSIKGSDRSLAEMLLMGAGRTREQASAEADAAINAVKKELTHPVTRAMIEENAPVREEGLSNQYHASQERLESMAAEHERRLAEYEANQGKTEGNAVTRTGPEGSRKHEEVVARGQGEGANRAGQSLQETSGEVTRVNNGPASRGGGEERKVVQSRGESETAPSTSEGERGGEVARPLSEKLVDKYGTTNNPLEAGFILNDGRMVPLHGEHDAMLNTVVGQPAVGPERQPMREDFINNEGAIRTRYRTGRGGQEVVFSIPKDTPINEEQIRQMRRSVGQMHNGNAVMEIAEPGGKSISKEFARPSDIDVMLRQIGAHPEDRAIAAETTANPEQAQIAAHEANGGSTFTPEGENLAGKDLYAVGAHPDRTLTVDKLTPEVLNKFKKDNADVLGLGDRTVGTWKDPDTGKTVLDISRVYGNREEAVQAGKDLNQKAIYHLGGEGEIPTGGTGELITPELSAEQLEASRETHPHIPDEVRRDMLPDELEFSKDKPQIQKNIVKELGNIKPSVEEIANAAKAGHALGGWWQRFIDTFKALGEPTEAAAIQQLGPSHEEALKAFHGALSGNKAVQDANLLAWNAYRDWLEAGRPRDRASINKIIAQNGKPKGVAAISDTMRGKKVLHEGLDTTKLWKLVNSPQMRDENPEPFTGNAFLDSPVEGVSSGAKKIPSMVATTAGKGNLDRVVFDTHMKDIYNQLGLTDAKYIADSIHMRRAAKLLGLKAGEGQEQVWGTVLAMKQLLGEGLSPEEVAEGLDDNLVHSIGKDYAAVILDAYENDPDFRETLKGLEKFGFAPTSEKALAKLREIVKSGEARVGTGPEVNREMLGKTAENLGRHLGVDIEAAREAPMFRFGYGALAGE